MPSPDHWYLLARYVAGDASDEEEQALRVWLGEDPARQAMLKQVQDIYEAGGEAEEPLDVDAAWQRFSGHMGEAPASRKPPRHLGDRPSVRDRRRRTYRHVGLGVLAVAVLLIALGPWILTESESGAEEEPWKTVTTGVGERATVELYDGSVVRLNTSSTLHYPPSFDDGGRVVRLDGEAYVEAASEPDPPFIVRVAAPPHVEVRVVGTAFLVKGYAGDGYTRVAVSEGRVAVGSDTEEPMPLEANDVAEVEAGGALSVAHGADLSAHLSWLEGRLVFEDTPLHEAAAAIERRYGVRIELADTSLEDRPITATFDRRDTIDDVIDVLARALDLHVDQTEEGIVLSTSSPR